MKLPEPNTIAHAVSLAISPIVMALMKNWKRENLPPKLKFLKRKKFLSATAERQEILHFVMAHIANNNTFATIFYLKKGHLK